MVDVGRIVEIAREIYQQKPNWATFYREILSPEGLVWRMFPKPRERQAFQDSGDYRELLEMLCQLREANQNPHAGPREATHVITVRLPKSLHEGLLAEAHDRHTSLNKLCIGKLLAPLPANGQAPPNNLPEHHHASAEILAHGQ